ncbi:transposable element Tcb1 transposase [Trichonephila clavipes]|nr:transposable element Tcb1 transposase [Trichonephila clavipes]
MVWDAIAYDTWSPLKLSNGTITSQRYVHDILQPHEFPLRNAGLPGAIFQQDNARPHPTRVSQDCLHHITILPWLARSPDVSPVEYIWELLRLNLNSLRVWSN